MRSYILFGGITNLNQNIIPLVYVFYTPIYLMSSVCNQMNKLSIHPITTFSFPFSNICFCFPQNAICIENVMTFQKYMNVHFPSFAI